MFIVEMRQCTYHYLTFQIRVELEQSSKWCITVATLLGVHIACYATVKESPCCYSNNNKCLHAPPKQNAILRYTLSFARLNIGLVFGECAQFLSQTLYRAVAALR